MRKLGLSLVFTAFLAACKAAPEPSPAGASAPVPPAADAPPPAPSAPETAPPAATSTEAPGALPKTYAESTKNIATKPGDRFLVALPANITVPMKWRIEPAPDAKVLALIEEKYFEEPPKGCDGCTGYGGTRVFSFETKGAGTTKLHFALKPLTNPGAKAEKEVTIEVTSAP